MHYCSQNFGRAVVVGLSSFAHMSLFAHYMITFRSKLMLTPWLSTNHHAIIEGFLSCCRKAILKASSHISESVQRSLADRVNL